MDDELLRKVEALRNLIASRLPDLTSQPKPELIGRQLAAGALSRAIVLLDGLLTLVGGSRGDAAGGLLRSIYEHEILGLYVLVGGPEAVLATMGDYSRSMKVFHQRNGTKPTLELQLWQALGSADKGQAGGDQRLNYEALALKVARLLRERGELGAEAKMAQDTYDTVYRSESMFSIHATLASIGPYLDFHARPWGLRDRSSVHDDLKDEDRIVLASSMIARLAAQVFESFGFGRAAVETLWRSIDTLPGPPR